MTPVSNSISPSCSTTPKPIKQNHPNRLPSATTMAYRRCQEEVQKLPPYVSSFTLSLGKRLISLVIDNTEKSLTILKLQKDDYIPHSLKSATTLSGSDEVSRTQSFTTLASSFHTTTTEYIASAKKLMVDAVILERNTRSKKNL
jgi:hypothetical protein